MTVSGRTGPNNSSQTAEARLFSGGGGVVIRCQDPEAARELILAATAAETPWWWEELTDEERDAIYPVTDARIVHGRFVPCAPGSDEREIEGYAWTWHRSRTAGHGATTAVEWTTT